MGRPRHSPSPTPPDSERVASPAVLDQHWLVSPLVDEPCWGASDDPFPAGRAGALGPWRRRNGPGAEEGRWRDSAHALLRVQPDRRDPCDYGDYVWQLRFRDNPCPQVVERLNGYLPTPLPTALPVDLAGAVAGFAAFVTGRPISHAASRRRRP